ncbi:putative glucomannan 4-beta-mannosyltransferase [Helianthus annuus]|nr:putative glucomannan 4-beta-mannosyltransferase [Helianthus annuus]
MCSIICSCSVKVKRTNTSMPLFVLVRFIYRPSNGSQDKQNNLKLHLDSHRSMHLLVLWILFENVMSFHRSKATIIGLLGANRVNEWVVTEKLGNATKQKSNVRPPKRSRPRLFERLLFSELLMGLFLLYVACYDIIFGKDHMFIYLLLQATAFFVVGVGYVGITVPN